MGQILIKLFSTSPRLYTSLLTALHAVCGFTVHHFFCFSTRPEQPTQLESLDPHILLANGEELHQPLGPRMQTTLE